MSETMNMPATPAPLSATISLAGPVAPPDPDWYAAWRHDLDELHAELRAAQAAVKAAIPGDGWPLVMRLDEALSSFYGHETTLMLERIAGHLPGLAGALRLVSNHVRDCGSHDRYLGCCETLDED